MKAAEKALKHSEQVIAFYISNHGFGHASRNVPVIREILSQTKDLRIIIKTDNIRVSFMKKNLADLTERIAFYDDCEECGLIAAYGGLLVDIDGLKAGIEKELSCWEKWIENEKAFLINNQVKLVVSDITPWVFKAAAQLKLPSILISNFTWTENYKAYLEERYWKPYRECYELAGQTIIYDFYLEELRSYNINYHEVSLVMRDPIEEELIQSPIWLKRNKTPFVFVSFGASVGLMENIHTEHLPYHFIVTAGTGLQGDNVLELPKEISNTMNYIALCDFAISKCGWSTLAEILLNQKPCALIPRGNTPEDQHILREIIKRGHGIGINKEDFISDLGKVLERLTEVKGDFRRYKDDRSKIAKIILNTIK